MSKRGEKISVLVVDDSALVRQILTDMISKDPDLFVIGTAKDGVEAVKLTSELDPDVVTMDINMPDMDGLSALEYIMKKSPRPVVMLSALVKEGADVTMKALELGAVDFILKPSEFPTSVCEIKDDVIGKIKAAAGSRVREVWERARKISAPRRLKLKKAGVRGGRMVVIGASAGGPRAISEVLEVIPKEFPGYMVVVQHMPGHFTESFAERLNERSGIFVKEAEDGEEVTPGCALVAPGGKDMLIEGEGSSLRARLLQTVARHGASPVIDVTMESVAKVFSDKAIGVILSGMGNDGAMGLGMIKDAGGLTIAQDESTCLVYGMPRVAIEMGLVDVVLPLEKIAKEILSNL
ncbi:MAG: chemotaxis response regulator protein-glutamate methylesterase [Actinomycetota bacterium]|nr:chemotaxis response regulator protein-glutamate methylesterase [Actinomycetota bacterium]